MQLVKMTTEKHHLQNPCKRGCYGRVRHLLVALDMLTLLHVSMTYICHFFELLLHIRVWYHVRPRNHMTFGYMYIAVRDLAIKEGGLGSH